MECNDVGKTSSLLNSSCIVEFNSHLKKWKTDYNTTGRRIDESVLNRSLSLLSASQNLDDFNPETLEKCQFYINLHKILNDLDKDSDLLWSAISILQLASRNLEARNALIYNFRFFPLLAKVLQKLIAEEKIHRLLTLMQELSYGIQITWEEPYLIDLINFLLKYICSDDDEDDEETTLGTLSLSILINICYKNFPVIRLLIKMVNVSMLCKKIKKYNILSNKLLIILGNNWVALPDYKDLSFFIKKSFIDCERAIQLWNISYLKHIIEFLIDSNNNQEIQKALKSYKDFEKDLQALITNTQSRLEMDDTASSTENNKIIQTCFSLIFQFINYILKLIYNEKQNNETNLELSSNILWSIYEFSDKWFESEIAGSNAIELFETIIKIANDELITKISTKLAILQKLIEIAENNQTNMANDFVAKLHKLFICLLQKEKTQKFIFANVTETYFNKIFQPLFAIHPDLLLHSTVFSKTELAKYLYGLLVLIEFSNIAESAWKTKLKDFFEMKQIQFLIAKGMLSENENICNLIFEISRLEDFPYKSVSIFISQLNQFHVGKVKQPESTRPQQFIDYDECITISRDCEARLEAVLDKISKINFENIAMSEMIELYNYQLDIKKNNIAKYLKQLENADDEITQLSHENSLMSAELKKYQNINFKITLIQEKLQIEVKDLSKQRDMIKLSSTELGRKLKEERTKYQSYSKTLELKLAEIASLQNDLTKSNEREEQYVAEMKKLKALTQENSSKIDLMKKSITKAEKEMKELNHRLDDKDKEATKLSKALEETKISVAKKDKLIQHLESQINEKNETIKKCEEELLETEEMRKMVLSLMESKKPKRKQ